MKNNNINTYFADELDPQEKETFLLGVAGNVELKEEFIESQHLMALTALLPQKDDEEKARQSLSEFMLKVKKKL